MDNTTQFYHLLLKGGPLVWPILFCSVAGLAIFLERLAYISRLRRLNRNLLRSLQANNPDRGPQATVIQQEGLNGHLERMLLDASRVRPEDARELETIFDFHIDATVSRAAKGLDMLATLASISPLLGLLGTVTGLIKAFMVIEKAGGQVNANSLAGGIWEAMLTTAVGLSVAIPLVIAHKVLASRLKGLEEELQQIAFTFMKGLWESAQDHTHEPGLNP